MKPCLSRFAVVLGLLASLGTLWLQAQQASRKDSAGGHKLRITSSTFSNNGTIPLSMVWNQCSAYPGGLDQSPQLSWTGAPKRTRSFIVVAYDVTASFTHWGMYNIPATTASLPQNAGVAGSSYGIQVSNDFRDLSYDGPCPPTTLMPLSHQYVFTVYALDITLPPIPAYGDFLPGAQALYHAMIAAVPGDAAEAGFFPSPFFALARRNRTTS